MENAAVLEGNCSGRGGVKSTGAMIPLVLLPLVLLKYFRSICEEMVGSGTSGSAGALVCAAATGSETIAGVSFIGSALATGSGIGSGSVAAKGVKARFVPGG